MASKYFRVGNKSNRILCKGIISVLIVTGLSALLLLQAYAYTSLSVTPIIMGYHSVPESSGTVASRSYSGIYWMVSDYTGQSTQTSVYAVNSKGGTVGRFPLQGASNWNWEDIAIDANNNLWVCDIGDNNAVRSNYRFYKVPEPNPYGGSRNIYPSATYYFRLPDGSKDMDSCFVWQGTPYVLTNSPTARVYKVPIVPGKTVTAQLVTYWSKDRYIGGADISKDGRRLALAAIYSDNQWIIERSSSSNDVKDFFTSPSREWKIHFNNGQGEGITFVSGKYDFVTVSESGTMRLVTQSMYGSSGPSSTTTTTTTTTSTSGSNKAYKLYFEGYDYDNANEVTITLNGKVVAGLPSSYLSGNNNAWTSYSMYITGSVISGTNTLTFKQSVYSSCVRNLRVVETSSGQTIFSYSSQRCITAGSSSSSISYMFNVS